MAYCACPKRSDQHSLDNPVFHMKRHRSVTVAVHISFGSIVSSPNHYNADKTKPLSDKQDAALFQSPFHRISDKQAHSTQVTAHWSLSSEDRYYIFKLLPVRF